MSSRKFLFTSRTSVEFSAHYAQAWFEKRLALIPQGTLVVVVWDEVTFANQFPLKFLGQ